ncbi:MAG TPA: WbqC family protein [Puia sp.]|nr:WbqC family protein [Puia sp.]
MNLITDFQYFPTNTLFKNLNKISNIVFEQYEYYQKMSFRNRCQIAGADGIIRLSIPLEHGRDQKTIMKDVRIAARQDWQGQHWKTIVSCYNRSPWFEFYQDELLKLYRRPFTFLMDWDLACFEWSVRTLGLSVKISLTDAFQKDYDEKDWLDLRGAIRPVTIGMLKAPHEPGSGSADHVSHVPGPGIVPSPAPAPPIKYRQVFEERTGFLPNLSILDLLFCEGKNARSFFGGIS